MTWRERGDLPEEVDWTRGLHLGMEPIPDGQIQDWIRYRQVLPECWADEWPLLEPKHLRYSDSFRLPLDLMAEPHKTHIGIWAQRVHPHHTERILSTVVDGLSDWIDTELLACDSHLFTSGFWKPLHEGIYRILICEAWMKAASTFGYEVDGPRTPIYALLQRSTSHVDFNPDILRDFAQEDA